MNDKAETYTRMKPAVLKTIKEKVTKIKPTEIYNECDIIDGPRNRKQIYNAKYRQQTKDNPGVSRGNFADHIKRAEDLVNTCPFVQSVNHVKNKIPSCILYTDEKIEDIKRFCCSAPFSQTTVLSFDKTFNLGQIHVTAGVFKNLSVPRKTTGDHPLFLGPMYLHGHSYYESYRQFFDHLAMKLEGTTSQPVTGSGEERSICKAMESAFPGGGRLSCTRHLQGNAQEYLKDKVGLCDTDKTKIMKDIFGKDGLVESDDSLVFDCRLHAVQETIDNLAPQFKKHFTNDIVPLLKNNIDISQKVGLLLPARSWTNNNSESINHVLKQAINWKPQPLPDLITSLHDAVCGQYRELERAVVGLGEFELCADYKRFSVPSSTWAQLPPEKRKRHLIKFMRHCKPVNSKIVESTDSTRHVIAPGQNGGKKKGQIKRKRVARTTTIKKQKLTY